MSFILSDGEDEVEFYFRSIWFVKGSYDTEIASVLYERDNI